MNTKSIPFNRAFIDQSDLAFMSDAIVEGHISGVGKYTKLVESLLELELNAQRCLLTTSCTHALEMSALLLNLMPGDEVIVPSYTFVSTANAFLLHGGTPVLVDSDSVTKNITPDSIRSAITSRTRAVCVVHYGGVSAEMDEITMICNENGITLIEDNAHGLFGTYRGRPLGSFGDMSTLSFHETKNFTCGEGGALVVNNPLFVERAEILREKGTDRSKFHLGLVDKYTWVDKGSSWVLSDLLAAVLWGQLSRRNEVQGRRSYLYKHYHRELGTWANLHQVQLPFCATDRQHTSHLFFLQFPDQVTRDLYISHMKMHGISVTFHYQALHLSPFGRANSILSGELKQAEIASRSLVRLPLFYSLDEDDMNRIIDATVNFEL
jgi:dTDP-4-amino-4,6-dideoxygalactose transaminase